MTRAIVATRLLFNGTLFDDRTGRRMTGNHKCDGFDVLTETYSIVDGHPIPTDILIPKSLPEGYHCPVIVRLHGGFLVRCIPFASNFHICLSYSNDPRGLLLQLMGDRGSDWLASHMIQFALSKNAILISADYRLLPEASGSDMLTDICVSLWEWMLNSFPTIVSKAHPGVTPDLTRIMATGALTLIENIS